MWLFVSIYITLLEAELNTEVERQTARGTTKGPEQPMGMPHAAKADTMETGPNVTMHESGCQP